MAKPSNLAACGWGLGREERQNSCKAQFLNKGHYLTYLVIPWKIPLASLVFIRPDSELAQCLNSLFLDWFVKNNQQLLNITAPRVCVCVRARAHSVVSGSLKPYGL